MRITESKREPEVNNRQVTRNGYWATERFECLRFLDIIVWHGHKKSRLHVLEKYYWGREKKFNMYNCIYYHKISGVRCIFLLRARIIFAFTAHTPQYRDKLQNLYFIRVKYY